MDETPEGRRKPTLKHKCTSQTQSLLSPATTNVNRGHGAGSYNRAVRVSALHKELYCFQCSVIFQLFTLHPIPTNNLQ